jgi:hypothetical protein
MTDEADALCARLAARVGGAWAPDGPGVRTTLERGLRIRLVVTVGEEGAGKVRIEVTPVVGWGWYVPVLLLPIVPMKLGYSWVLAIFVAVASGFAVRWLGRTVMRVRAEVRRGVLERHLAKALAAEAG